jgi:nicotinic acid mononucleotide adenylyltransferase|nr:MAG TPA: nicotinic acid mononucleotide adenylyltransferase [Caudoviricetes sp.]
MPKTDISSTYIRKQLKEHKEIYPYVPMEVFNYILKRNLYDGF